MFKRLFDIALSLALVVFLMPVMLVVALLVYLAIGKPVLFRQQRPGLGGKPFYLYKFRSMLDSRGKEGKHLSVGERLTGFGRILRRTSIDELPQLINVLRGELSFVRARPLLMQYLERYTPEQARRHEVKPGITGWAQVNGRNAISWEEKFELDVWYVDNRNILVDLKILWLTLIKVLKAEGVNRDALVTMPEFTGRPEDRFME